MTQSLIAGARWAYPYDAIGVLGRRAGAAPGGRPRGVGRAGVAAPGGTQETLDGMLGPAGECRWRSAAASPTRTSEITSPLDKNSAAGQAAARRLDLPGYNIRRDPGPGAREGQVEPRLHHLRQSFEQSLREAGFGSVRSGDGRPGRSSRRPRPRVSQLLPQLLRIDSSGETSNHSARRCGRVAVAFHPSVWRAASFAAAASSPHPRRAHPGRRPRARASTLARRSLPAEAPLPSRCRRRRRDAAAGAGRRRAARRLPQGRRAWRRVFLPFSSASVSTSSSRGVFSRRARPGGETEGLVFGHLAYPTRSRSSRTWAGPVQSLVTQRADPERLGDRGGCAAS